MPMNVRFTDAALPGPKLIQPECFEDDRGFFLESYSRRRFLENGLDVEFVQDNHSRSRQGVLRGFHFQDRRAPQWRLVRCTVGRICDVVVDLRPRSPAFGRWCAFELSADNKTQVLIPPEFAHGFCVLSDVAEVQYKCSNFHSPEAERTLAWDDPDVAVQWPIADPTLSDRDRTRGASLASLRQSPAFV
jgi:dTDP-4-dehydrorhamnose 3,5-epimerase